MYSTCGRIRTNKDERRHLVHRTTPGRWPKGLPRGWAGEGAGTRGSEPLQGDGDGNPLVLLKAGGSLAHPHRGVVGHLPVLAKPLLRPLQRAAKLPQFLALRADALLRALRLFLPRPNPNRVREWGRACCRSGGSRPSGREGLPLPGGACCEATRGRPAEPPGCVPSSGAPSPPGACAAAAPP